MPNGLSLLVCVCVCACPSKHNTHTLFNEIYHEQVNIYKCMYVPVQCNHTYMYKLVHSMAHSFMYSAHSCDAIFTRGGGGGGGGAKQTNKQTIPTHQNASTPRRHGSPSLYSALAPDDYSV